MKIIATNNRIWTSGSNLKERRAIQLPEIGEELNLQI